MNHSLRTSGRPRFLGAVGVGLAGVLALSACGGGGSDTATTSTTTSTTSAATSSSSTTSVPGSDDPIGSAGIDLSQTSSTSYPPEMRSQDFARDCYLGGDRIYARSGITCSGAQKVLTAYEASSHSAAGTEMKVESYSCSHNPDVMVSQGAAPGKCVDGDGTVVFNWRYPGAPQPAKK